MEQTIILNIGGVKYETLRSTLTAHPDTLLGTMFAERNKHLLKPKNGNEYFIDRNGHVFHYIMEYYRTGVLSWPTRDSEDNKCTITLQAFNTELDYFQIKVNQEDQRDKNIILQLSKSLDSFVFYLEENLSKYMENMEPEIWLKITPDAEPKFWTKNLGWVPSPFTTCKSLTYQLMKKFYKEIYEHLTTTFKGTDIEKKSQNNDNHVEIIFTPNEKDLTAGYLKNDSYCTIATNILQATFCLFQQLSCRVWRESHEEWNIECVGNTVKHSSSRTYLDTELALSSRFMTLPLVSHMSKFFISTFANSRPTQGMRIVVSLCFNKITQDHTSLM
ncbi:2311_t:CDS:2 [Ambispora gerdemannii]|uniref:2311_t:CDS:1 n=1 Tax=Ambispora gerdemannii TaxID=144530 RepID=A0A9N8ZC68_9GLOM|nr:2311_t:CDS:2 [Ambispora gerdemannii]